MAVVLAVVVVIQHAQNRQRGTGGGKVGVGEEVGPGTLELGAGGVGAVAVHNVACQHPRIGSL
eukprot:scaffold11156_cov101-Isochrysis_galbana.AAC.3